MFGIDGTVSGSGIDDVGKYIISGISSSDTMKLAFTKLYIAGSRAAQGTFNSRENKGHAVEYRGACVSGLVDTQDGARVVLHSLATSSFNGSVGVVVSYDAARGRFAIRLWESGAMAAIRPKNIHSCDQVSLSLGFRGSWFVRLPHYEGTGHFHIWPPGYGNPTPQTGEHSVEDDEGGKYNSDEDSGLQFYYNVD
jgi:hypothetical protein